MHNKARSQKREKQVAKDIGGRAHIASGALWFRKSDASNELLLIEDKFTDSNVYRVEYKTLLKLEQQALKIGKTPIFRFGYEKAAKNFVIVRACDYNYPEKIDTAEVLTVEGVGVALPLSGVASNMSKKPHALKIEFTKFNKLYFLFDYDDFIESLADFTA